MSIRQHNRMNTPRHKHNLEEAGKTSHNSLSSATEKNADNVHFTSANNCSKCIDNDCEWQMLFAMIPLTAQCLQRDQQ